nr:ribonuclease H-like domain-containing protein [Tanacetum cinerariifolium]
MHKAFSLPVMEFLLPGEVPSASEESSHCQKKREATAVKIALLLKSRRNCQSKLDDSYTKLVPHVTPYTVSDGTGKKKGRIVTVTADDMQKRKNDVKARTTLLLSLPDEHQLRFKIEQDDLNKKFLTSLAPEWLMHTIVWRNRSDLDTMSLDDLYNHLKDWSYMANDEENHVLVADKEAPIEFALMAKTSAKNKVFNNSLYSTDCKKNTDSLNSKITDLTDKLFDAKNMIYHYKLGLAQVESRLAEYKDQEIKYCKKIRGLELKVEFKTNSLECLTKELETLKKEKKGLDGKLAGFQTASKDIVSLLESQRLDKNKEGLGYSAVPPPPALIL